MDKTATNFSDHKPTEEHAQGAQSILRAVAVLKTVARHNEAGIRLSVLARKLGLHVATARRILQVMVEEGFLAHDKATNLYRLGLELYRLGGQARQYQIRDLLRGCLEEIARQTHDTVFLLIRSGNDVLCVDRVQGQYPIRTILVDVGARRPLGIGAGSLALIAFGPDEELGRMLAVNAPRYPQYKGLTAERIRDMALQGRSKGYILSDGLFHEDAVSVGVPIMDPAGQVAAAITVSAIRQRMDPARRDEIARLVTEMTKPLMGGLGA